METLRPARAAERGMSRSALYRAAAAGDFERIARGLYRPTDAPPADWDWLEAASRRDDATICLTSALAYHDLTDAIPDALEIAIPRGSRIPVSEGAIRWHLFARESFEIGREQIEIPGTTETIGIYSPQRTIVDAFRLRGALGYELGRDALRAWLRRGGKPADIMDVATRIPRSKGPLLHALELLA
ncbi:type IV toxin-antitoxin system AbiEi family antitoxin domain-containing protein [Nocardioides sp. AE5]|uniref:type IV toxin-antitoxin system AbiEi family antitoxin domain-containing protein n=1 Tax=Nocardioides sp. AE5 TaxID=2962573 RepID=UPI002880E6B1|nr:type IV toxin-antitoxin system AbiEi family antitoxin domain-containing protein [Nocardioides sp. AE5]MDT0203728.1 type IV toxin-antitoxin system AbiEi family antitoxin domain-containing protein [Nocardioides sp. AE5]